MAGASVHPQGGAVGRLNGLDRCGECILGRGTDQVGTVNWKNRKQTIANKLQDFATVISDKTPVVGTIIPDFWQLGVVLKPEEPALQTSHRV
jgi:hypothetical protein